MSLPSTDTTGRRRFELKKRIGAGAFGEVFLAEQVSGGGFRRLVALKLLNETAARMKEASRRMRDEARILGRLSHRHIVEVLDLVQLGDRWAVVMAYVPGADLEQVLTLLDDENRALPAPAACAVGAAVGRALHAAWLATDDQGRPLHVVHRDIKPSNVRITEDGEVKVLDFGVARVELEEREAKTRRPGLIGTEIYMSPERLLVEGDGPEGDVYALAATVVELIRGDAIGRSPVRDEAHAAFADAIAADLRPRLQGPEHAIDELVTTIRAALDANPAVRPDAGALARVLEEASRRLDGASLAAFCLEVVPAAERAGALTQEATTGTLVEGQTPIPSATLFDLPEDDAPRPTPVRGALGLALLCAVAALGLSAWLLLPTPTTRTPVTEPVEAHGSAATIEAAGSVPAAVEPAPVVAPAPAPVAAPTASATPTSTARTAPVDEPTKAEPHARTSRTERKASPSQVDVTPAVVAPPIATAPHVSRAMFVVTDVSGVEVRCGDRSFHGTTSVRAVDFPAGACTVRVEREGAWRETSVVVDAPREVVCALNAGSLACH